MTSGSHTLRIIALQPGKTPGEVVIIPCTTAGVIARPAVDIARLKKGTDGKLYIDKDLKKELESITDKPWFPVMGVLLRGGRVCAAPLTQDGAGVSGGWPNLSNFG